MPRHALKSYVDQLRTDIEAEIAALPKGSVAYFIAASDSTAADKLRADYVCTGSDIDHILINTVITLVYAAGGGSITLSQGTFFLGGPLLLYGTSSTITPTINFNGQGMDATYLRPAVNVHAIHVGKSTQVNITNMAFELDGASDGIHDIDGLVAGDSIGWRMRHCRFENLKWSGKTTHTGWGMEIQPFRMMIQNLEGNTGRTGYTYPANGIKLSARSTPNTGATFNSGDSLVSRVQISISGLVAGSKAIWIDTDDSSAANYDSSYFNQIVFQWVGLRSNVTGVGTGWQFGHAGANKVRSVLIEGTDTEQFAVGFDLYNTQNLTVDSFYTGLVGNNAIYWRTDNNGTTNNSVNNWWRSGGTVGVFSTTQDVIVDNNTDALNPNVYEKLFVETSGGTARINGSTSASLPAGVVVKDIRGQQRTGTRHPALNEPLAPISTVSGLQSILDNKATKYALTYNYVATPSFEAGLFTWTTYASGSTAGSLDTTQGFSGSQSIKVTSVSAIDGGFIYATPVLQPGTYYFSLYAKMDSSVTRAAIVIRTVAGAVAVQLNPAYPGNTNWNRYGGSFVVATATSYNILLGLGYSGTSAGTINFDAVQVELGAQTAYFDGSSTATSTQVYSWAGSANNSTSVRQTLSVVTSINGNVGDVTIAATTDATTGAKGIVQLAGDLAGTAALPTVPGLALAALKANNLSDLASASTARTNLGLVIGTNVQAWDTDLDTWATKTAPTDAVVGISDAQTITNKNLTSGTNTFPTFNQNTTGSAATATTAGGLITASSPVVVSAAAAPKAGQVLTATSATTGTWQPAASTGNLSLAPAGSVGETYSRTSLISTFASGIGTGNLYVRAIYLPAGVVVSNITMINGGTAESGGSHGWYVLLDSSRVVKAVTADQTGNTWAPSNATITLPVGTPYTTTYGGLYYVGVCVVATTMPTILGSGNLGNLAIMGVAPIIMGTSSTAQSTPPALAATMTAITASSTYNFYAYIT